MKDEFFLSQKSVPAVNCEEDIQVAHDLLETLEAHKEGCVGMAANMIGISKRIIAFDNEGSYMVMFNPEIVSFSGEQTGREGCLSLPNVGGDVTRPFEVTVQFLDIKGVPQIVTARGFLARAVCHETDHLKGILYVDHMDEKSRDKVLKKLLKQKIK